MLAVLASRGVLERHEPGRYRLGLRMFEFGQLALSRLNLFEASVPVLAALRDRVRDLVQLGVPMGAEVLFLDRFEAQNLDPRFHGQQWRRVPAHSSSSGRAIAAFNPTVARSIFEAGLIRRTRYTVVDPRRLGEILAEIRRRGYAATHEELEEGISSVAAPILIGDGDDRPGHRRRVGRRSHRPAAARRHRHHRRPHPRGRRSHQPAAAAIRSGTAVHRRTAPLTPGVSDRSPGGTLQSIQRLRERWVD